MTHRHILVFQDTGLIMRHVESVIFLYLHFCWGWLEIESKRSIYCNM